MSDLSPEEFKSNYLGTIMPSESERRLTDAVEVEAFNGESRSADWRGIHTTPIEYQGNCGSCWAFGAIQQIESDAMPSEPVSPPRVLFSRLSRSCNAPTANHAVQIVGVNVNEGYWIIRNSWGDWWGDQGYMKLALGADTCLLENYTVYTTVAAANGLKPQPTSLPTFMPSKAPEPTLAQSHPPNNLLRLPPISRLRLQKPHVSHLVTPRDHRNLLFADLARDRESPSAQRRKDILSSGLTAARLNPLHFPPLCL